MGIEYMFDGTGYHVCATGENSRAFDVSFSFTEIKYTLHGEVITTCPDCHLPLSKERVVITRVKEDDAK